MFKGLLYQFTKRKNVVDFDKRFANWLVLFDEVLQDRHFINIESEVEELCDKVFQYATSNDIKSTKEIINLIRWSNFVKRKHINVEEIDKKDRETREEITKTKKEIIDTPIYVPLDEEKTKQKKADKIYSCEIIALELDNVLEVVYDLNTKIKNLDRVLNREACFILDNSTTEKRVFDLVKKIDQELYYNIMLLLNTYDKLTAKTKINVDYQDGLLNKLKENKE